MLVLQDLDCECLHRVVSRLLENAAPEQDDVLRLFGRVDQALAEKDDPDNVWYREQAFQKWSKRGVIFADHASVFEIPTTGAYVNAWVGVEGTPSGARPLSGSSGNPSEE